MSAGKTLISVVIISYNGMEFIEDCLATVYAGLKTSDSEVIVVDNASHDGTVNVIKSGFPQVKLIANNDNLGFARAVNQGIMVAKGNLIFLLNQDTKIIGDALLRLVARMESDSRIGTIGPKFIGFDGNLQKSARAFPRYRDLFYEFTGLSYLFPQSEVFGHWKMGWFDHLSEREVDQPMGAALMVRREVINKIGDFDETFGMFFNDVDFCRRVKESGLINLYFPGATVAHFVGGSTRKRKASMIIESHRSMYKYFRKYHKKVHTLPLLYFWGAMLFIAAYIRAAALRLFRH